MKINILTEQVGLEYGGIQNTSFLIGEELSKLGHSIEYYYSKKSVLPFGTIGFCVKKKDHFRMQYIFDAVSFCKIASIPDVCIATTWQSALGALFLKAVRKVPYYVLIHGNEVMPNKKIIPISTVLRKMVLKNANSLFANSEFTSTLVSRITRSKVNIISPPIRFRTINKTSESHNMRMLSIGRIVERKGFQDVIRTMPLLIEKYPTLQYRIVGEGEYKQELIRLTEQLSLGNHVVFLGRVDEERKELEIDNCDFLIMPSHIDEKSSEVEGFGIVYIEANMHYKWVIANDVGGVSSAVKDGITGRLIHATDSFSISSAVVEFYDKPELVNKERLVNWAKSKDVSVIVKEYLRYIQGDLV